MLLVGITGQTRTGSICPHSLKMSLYKVNCRTCGTLTWALSIWPMMTLRYTSIAIMLSTTMSGLHRHRQPHRPLYAPTSIPYIHLSNQTFCRRKLLYLTAQIRMPWLSAYGVKIEISKNCWTAQPVSVMLNKQRSN